VHYSVHSREQGIQTWLRNRALPVRRKWPRSYGPRHTEASPPKLSRGRSGSAHDPQNGAARVGATRHPPMGDPPPLPEIGRRPRRHQVDGWISRIAPFSCGRLRRAKTESPPAGDTLVSQEPATASIRQANELVFLAERTHGERCRDTRSTTRGLVLGSRGETHAARGVQPACRIDLGRIPTDRWPVGPLLTLERAPEAPDRREEACRAGSQY
jgi:hypothetical protein